MTSVLSSLFAMVAAGTSIGCNSNAPKYGIGFYNGTMDDIRDSRADWLVRGVPTHDGAGVLAPDSPKSISSEARPIPEKATVTWKTAVDGKTHRKEVEVANRIADPKNFAGTIWYKFMPDGSVTVVPLTYEEMSRLAVEQKPWP